MVIASLRYWYIHYVLLAGLAESGNYYYLTPDGATYPLPSRFEPEPHAVLAADHIMSQPTLGRGTIFMPYIGNHIGFDVQGASRLFADGHVVWSSDVGTELWRVASANQCYFFW
jgi:prepilin-type processing-associated H-X9-DG protein